MSNPYRLKSDEYLPSPYAPLDHEMSFEPVRREEEQRDNQDQSQSSSGVAAFVPGQEQAVVQQAGQVLSYGSHAASAASGSATASVGSVAGGVQTATAYAAAVAQVQSIVNAALAVNGVLAPIGTAIMAAVSTVGPFATLAVLSAAGVQNAEQVKAIAASIPAQLVDAIVGAIDAAVAEHAGESEVTIMANAQAIFADIVADVQAFALAASSEAASHQAAHQSQSYVAPVAHAEGDGLIAENTTGVVARVVVDDAGGPGLSLRLADDHGGLFSLNGHDVVLNRPFDYETSVPVVAEVIVANHGGWEVRIPVAVTPTNVNEAPTLGLPIAGFQNGELYLSLPVSDPDGEAIPAPTYSYTLAELATDVPGFDVVVTDAGGLTSNAVHVDPPSLGAQAAADNPQPPVIIGYSLSSLPENQQGTLTVLAYDAIDGVISREIEIEPQNYEAGEREIKFDGLSLVGGLQSLASVTGNVTGWSVVSHTNTGPGGGEEIKLLFSYADMGYVPEVTLSGGYGARSISIVEVRSDGVVVSVEEVYGPGQGDNMGAVIEIGGPREISVPVEITNSSGLTASATHAIDITDANEAPLLVSVSGPSAVPENSSATFAFTYMDPEQGAVQHTINVGPFNYESGASLRAISDVFVDNGGLSASGSVEYAVTNVNEAPRFIASSNVLQQLEERTIVQTLGATDPDGGRLTFRIVNDFGEDWRIRQIDDDTAQIYKPGDTYNYDDDNSKDHPIRVSVTDDEGLSDVRTFIVREIDIGD